MGSSPWVHNIDYFLFFNSLKRFSMNLRSLQKVFAGLKSSDHGLQHWLLQKVTAIILIPTTLLFIYFFSEVFGKSHQFMTEFFSNKMIGLITILFIVTSLVHLRQGLQVIIEDYVHNTAVNKFLLKIITWSTRILSLLSILALGKLAFIG